MQYRVGILSGLSIIALIILYFAGIPHDNSLTQLQQKGVIRIGYALEAPYAYIGSNGDITGESPEVAKVVVSSLGITRIEWVQTDFDLLISGLQENRFDVIAAGMFITPERAQRVRFSNPTFHVQPGLLVRAGNPLRLHSYQDIVKSPAVKVALISDSVEEKYFRSAGVGDPQIVVVPDALTGQSAVLAGLADGLALSSATVRWMAANDQSGLSEAAQPFSATLDDPKSGYGAFAFRPQDNALAEAWNQALASTLGTPEHIKLIQQFGFSTEELPGSVTTIMVLER